jgi:hypothetical protein
MTPFPLIDASQLPAVTARPAVVLLDFWHQATFVPVEPPPRTIRSYTSGTVCLSAGVVLAAGAATTVRSERGTDRRSPRSPR